MRLRTPLLAASFALLTSFTWSSLAGAQQTPPDVVRLKDGSMFRGTIAELVANDHVDLVTANGQTRRFAMKDVSYAGSSATAQPDGPTPPPPPPPPPPGAQGMITVNAQRAEMRFDANEPDIQFQLRTGQSQAAGVGWGFRSTYSFAVQESNYTTICTAPCSGSLPTGTHRLGLSHNGKTIIEPDEPVTITGSGTLHGTYTSHLGLRVTGFVVDLASIAAGITLMVTAIHVGTSCDANHVCTDEDSVDGTKIGVGLGVLVVGSIVGTVLMLQKDTAEISFVPLSPVASSGAKELAALRAPGMQPQGMALQLRF